MLLGKRYAHRVNLMLLRPFHPSVKAGLDLHDPGSIDVVHERFAHTRAVAHAVAGSNNPPAVRERVLAKHLLKNE